MAEKIKADINLKRTQISSEQEKIHKNQACFSKITSGNSRTGLYLALQNENYKVLKYLLTLPEIDINIYDNSGNTILYHLYDIYRNLGSEIVDTVLSKKIDNEKFKDSILISSGIWKNPSVPLKKAKDRDELIKKLNFTNFNYEIIINNIKLPLDLFTKLINILIKTKLIIKKTDSARDIAWMIRSKILNNLHQYGTTNGEVALPVASKSRGTFSLVDLNLKSSDLNIESNEKYSECLAKYKCLSILDETLNFGVMPKHFLQNLVKNYHGHLFYKNIQNIDNKENTAIFRRNNSRNYAKNEEISS
jgi:hypothetical protein